MVRAVRAFLLVACVVVCIVSGAVAERPKKSKKPSQDRERSSQEAEKEWLSAADRDLFLHTPAIRPWRCCTWRLELLYAMISSSGEAIPA